MMHEAGVAHRDIKPENIAIDRRNNAFYLFDLGLADYLQLPDDPDEIVWGGTPEYMLRFDHEVRRRAVEQQNPVVYDYITRKKDIWALGYALYVMFSNGKELCKEDPFLGFSIPPILIDEGLLRKNNVPQPLYEILRKMVALSAADRPSTEEILNELSHLSALPL